MATTIASAAPARAGSLWYDPRARAIFYQILAITVLVLCGWYLIHNTLVNLERQNIASGFGFLDREAGFAISESVIAYDASDNYRRAFLVGLLNTVRMALIGVVLATVIGVVVGIARLSKNWLVAKLASVYVEVVRNIPLLLQLFVWYAIITESMPHPREQVSLAEGVYITNRGIYLPWPEAHPVFPYMLLALVVALVLAVAVSIWAKRHQERTGQTRPAFLIGLSLVIGLPALVWLFGGAPTDLSVPELQGFNFRGGMTLTPEFTALLCGLTFYTAGFIAEIVRSGILAVPHGQHEAASALGLRKGLVMRLVILPQALRIIIPPTTSQYLNLTKNSSLAVAIGYPDLVSIGNTTLNQTGQAIEAILIFMAVYLTISLLISLFMNWYNNHIRLVER